MLNPVDVQDYLPFSPVFVTDFVVFLSDILKVIPMAALVAVMIMVSIGTFNWQSLKELKTHPIGFNVVMLVTVAIVVYTHNLALGVFSGVLLSALFFANKIGRYMVVKTSAIEKNELRYDVIGQVFLPHLMILSHNLILPVQN